MAGDVTLKVSDERHPFVMSGIRIAVGVWLVFLFAALLYIGDWWGAVLLVPAGISLGVGVHVLRGATRA